jgi:hypothetical protein
MAEKKQKQQVKSIYKILAIAGCILFVFLMVVSAMGSSWITAFKSVKPGDTVTTSITVKDRNGDALITSDQQVAKQLLQNNVSVFYTKQLVFTANQSATEAMFPLPVTAYPSGWSGTFALFGGEHDAITSALVGMKTNEEKEIPIPFSGSMTQTWSAAQLTGQGVNMTDVHVGDQLSMAVGNEETLSKNATSSAYSVRIGEVTQKSADSVTIDFGYPSIVVKVVSISGNS